MIIGEDHVSILDVNADCVICTVNTEGYMGRGVALYLRKAIPGLYPQYKALCQRKLLTVDKLWLYSRSSPRILCFPTKDKCWESSRLEWIEHNLKKLRDVYKKQGIKRIACPPLGCANGGLDWNDVRPLIYDILGDCDLEVFICHGRKR